MKLTNFFADIYKPKRLFDRSPETTRLYNVSIRSFDKTLGRASTLKDLTDANLRRHMERVVSNGRSKATANKDRAQLLAIWRLAFSMRMVETSPDVQAYKEPERSPVAWLASDLEKIFAAIDKTAGHFGTIPQDIWWKALVRVALETGERIGALISCRWDWLHDDWLFIPAEVRKGSRSDRSYRLSPEAVAILAEMRSKRQPGELIFHWPYSYNYLWTKYKAILNAAKLPPVAVTCSTSIAGRREALRMPLDWTRKTCWITNIAAPRNGIWTRDLLARSNRATFWPRTSPPLVIASRRRTHDARREIATFFARRFCKTCR